MGITHQLRASGRVATALADIGALRECVILRELSNFVVLLLRSALVPTLMVLSAGADDANICKPFTSENLVATKPNSRALCAAPSRPLRASHLNALLMLR